MTPVNQTIFGIGGDCLSACLASLLDMHTEDVPVFRGRNQYTDMFVWLDSRGYSLTMVNPDEVLPTGFYLACGPSPRLPNSFHAVIVNEKKELIWDPILPEIEKKGILSIGYIFSLSKSKLFGKQGKH